MPFELSGTEPESEDTEYYFFIYPILPFRIVQRRNKTVAIPSDPIRAPKEMFVYKLIPLKHIKFLLSVLQRRSAYGIM